MEYICGVIFEGVIVFLWDWVMRLKSWAGGRSRAFSRFFFSLRFMGGMVFLLYFYFYFVFLPAA